MKKLLLAVLLLPAFSARTQSLSRPPAPLEVAPPAGQEASTPFPLANVIVVHTSDSARTAYLKLAQLLRAQGYQLEKTDQAHGLITTHYHRTAYHRGVKASLQFTIRPQGAGAIIEERAIGQVISASSRFPVECRGTAKMPIASAWAEMWRMASCYPAGSLAYKRH
ncbi:hypothetical protein SAMN00120144_4221 [Hymenobacter roseosalivarius DSM 11622]|uniref:Uncharacterized protein n=1 Tax=Hymenobacter roseosalivarius DSM 11622 TaxID=645990 RepID=A0A1W1UFC1_9BACT|nr:hypothetical protein [Hymenobacter roseosalivarius]SMB79787.1 hypothetical protein SAMN00120144_4221 [Hymenobacter roseosalivarius DSM 11622]